MEKKKSCSFSATRFLCLKSTKELINNSYESIFLYLLFSRKKVVILAVLFAVLSYFTCTKCSSEVFAASISDIRITEFMADPSAVSDSNGEWIEITAGLDENQVVLLMQPTNAKGQ